MFRHILPAMTLFGIAALSSTSALAQYPGADLGRTCPRVVRNGPFISATCYDAYLRPRSSSIDVRSCGGGDVGNANGILACSGGGYGGGYGYAPPPRFHREFHRRDEF